MVPERPVCRCLILLALLAFALPPAAVSAQSLPALATGGAVHPASQFRNPADRLPHPTQSPASLASRVLVVYDPTVPDSVNVANHYLTARGIPSANLCAITPPETVFPLSWSVWLSSVKAPIQSCLDTVGPDQILYIVLSYIRPFGLFAENGKQYSVDGYIADIWDVYSTVDAFPYPAQNHPYFAAAENQGNSYEPFVSFAAYRAQPGALRIYSVWRLDGATAALAMGLVDKALAAEANGLAGQACLDRIYGPIGGVLDSGYGSGDWDLHQAAVFTGQAGFSVTEDSHQQEFGTLPAPMCPNAALYSGWYSLNHYNDAFTWNTGAIGFHLASLAAADPRSGPNWSANAIKKGIAVTSGAMAEPFLQGMAHPGGFFQNLLEGASVGDAFMRNTAWLKWMILNLGDPLYLPFPGGRPPFNGPNPQASLILNPQYPVGPASSTGTVVLPSPAPPGGTVVNLSSNRPSVAAVPASVTVPQGATSANFNITTTLVTSNTPVVISTSGGITQSNTLSDSPLLGGLFTIFPSLIGGGPITAAVALDANAPPGGTVVALSSSNPAVAPVPATVTVPQGAFYFIFTIETKSVGANTPVTFAATLDGARTVVNVTVLPVLSALNLSMKTVVGGNNVNGTVVLTGPAYAGGITVNLSSSDPSVASVPSSVTVPAGMNTAVFPITTFAVASSTPVTISAVSGGPAKTATLTVTPPALKSLSLSPTTVTGGQSSTGTVTLSGPAPAGGTSVALSSSNPGVAEPPASVTVLSGASSANFYVTTFSVHQTTVVNITATYGGSKTAPLTVKP
jgi:uncharacterized protein (TIGR03790 family)